MLIFHVSERTGEFSFQCVVGIGFIIFGNALVVYVQLYFCGTSCQVSPSVLMKSFGVFACEVLDADLP